MELYFTDVFDVPEEELEKYEDFNISLSRKFNF